MKNITKVVFCLLFLVSLTARSQNAPVTTAGTILSHGSTVIVPITVTNFVDIGAISLMLDYDITVVQVSAISINPAFSNFTTDWTSIPGHIGFSWYGEAGGVTLSDFEHLADITFVNLHASETTLTWIDDGSSCEYVKYDGGNYTILTDSPTGDFYINGQITYQRSAPVTIAPIYTSAPNLPICIPINVVGFADIGSIALTMNYNPSVLTFTGFTTTNVPGTWDFSVLATTPGTMIVSGYGPGLTLTGTSILFNACFVYHGGTTTLAWNDANGTDCEYTDATTLTPLYDLPQSTFYIDGVVTAPLIADFDADYTTPPRNTTVTFSDLSKGGPTSWDWSFDRTTFIYMPGSNSQSQNPQVQFTEGGPYTVTLTVHNAYLTDSKVKIAYIWVGIPGLWTGETSTDWFTTTNWDNWLVPTNLIDIVIPAAALNWPFYLGDFTIGIQCKTITLSASTSQMTITGNIIIP